MGGMRSVKMLLKTANNGRFVIQCLRQLHWNCIKSARTHNRPQESLLWPIKCMERSKYVASQISPQHHMVANASYATYGYGGLTYARVPLTKETMFENFDSHQQCCHHHDHAHNPDRNCWKCGKGVNPNVNVFCECGVVQRPDWKRNLFGVLGMQETFDVDTKELTTAFRDLQRLLHPDKFALKSETERGIADQQSSRINRAYDCLIKPLTRGLYLLEVHGFSIEEGEIQMDPEFLMEIMETNERLADVASISEAREIGDKNSITLSELISKLSVAFKEHDYAKAKVILTRMKYFANIDEKVKEIERLNMDKISDQDI